MNRQMMREQRKDRKKINKKITDMIKRASQKDEDKILKFVENQTPLWEILLCYQYQSNKQIQSLTTKVLQNILCMADDEIGFASILTVNTTLSFDERCTAFLAMVRSKNHDMDEISTGTLYYLLQLFEELLKEEELLSLEDAYKSYKQMILSIQLHNILPLAHISQEKLIESCKNDLAFTILIITAWLFLHECSLLHNVRDEWVSGVDTLDALFVFLEIDNPCLKDIIVNGIDDYLLEDINDEKELAQIIKLCDMIAEQEAFGNITKYELDIEIFSEGNLEDAHTNEDDLEDEHTNEDDLDIDTENSDEDDLEIECDLDSDTTMIISERDKRLTRYFQYCFEIQNELERIMSYYCSIILMTHQSKEISDKDKEIEKLNKQLNKSKKSQEKLKEQLTLQNDSIRDLEHKLKQSNVNNSPIIKENERLQKENQQFKNNISYLKSQITQLKERNRTLEKYEKYEKGLESKDKEEKSSKKQPAQEDNKALSNEDISISQITSYLETDTNNTFNEEKNEEELFYDMTKEINKHKITILGGPARFSRRVKEYLPNARVIDMGSKFGEIRIGSSDYVVVYWKMLGHARTMQVESQIKGSSTKIIYVDSTNKFELCKTIYENL